MADSTTAVEIFKALDQDYALTGLRKLFGCMVDQLWKSSGSCSDTSNVLIQGLAWFNGGVLILAGIVACYLLYSMVADTANDGEAFGRSTDTRYTLLRTGIGATLFLPISNGLSLVQLLVIQLAIWSSGFGDTLWSKIAATNLTGMYSTPDLSTLRAPDFVVRKAVADALRARTYGYVCRYALQNAAKTLSGSTQPITPKTRDVEDVANTSTKTTVSYFEANSYYRSSTSLCGSISYTVSLPYSLQLSGADQTYSNLLFNLTQNAATAALTSAWTKIDTAANSIAVKITGGENPESAAQRNSEDIRNLITQGVTDATQQLISTLSSNITSQTSELNNARTQYLDLSKQNGWITSVLWQRSMASIYAKLMSIINSAQITSTLPADPGTYLPWLSSYREGYQQAVDQFRRDIDYVTSFEALFTSLGQAPAASLATETITGQSNEDKQVGSLIRSIYISLLGIIAQPEATTWKDPYLELQQIGTALGPAVAWTGTGAAASGVASFVPGTVGNLANTAASVLLAITITLFIIAFIVGGLLPLMPVLYFIAAATSWFLVVVEAMIAMPIWLVTKFFPARSPSLVGESRRGYVFALGLLLRPALIVIGLIASIVMARVGLDLINLMFRGILAMMVPEGTLATAVIGLGALAAYAMALFSLITFSSSLITTLPETVIGWIDATITSSAASDLGRSFAAAASQPPSIGRLEPRNAKPYNNRVSGLRGAPALTSGGVPGLGSSARPLSISGPASPRLASGSSSPKTPPLPPR